MTTETMNLSCPIGSHLVKEHIRHDKPSKNNPTGVSIVKAHCRKNRGHKYDAASLQKIADEFSVKKFPVLKIPKQKIAANKHGKNVDWDIVITYYKHEQNKSIKKQKCTNDYKKIFKEMK